MKKPAQIYDCLKKFILVDSDENFRNKQNVTRARNRLKIEKVFINWKFSWYIKLGKLSRNLHIETTENGEVNLFTDY